MPPELLSNAPINQPVFQHPAWTTLLHEKKFKAQQDPIEFRKTTAKKKSQIPLHASRQTPIMVCMATNAMHL